MSVEAARGMRRKQRLSSLIFETRASCAVLYQHELYLTDHNSLLFIYLLYFVLRNIKWENTSLPVLLIDNSEIEDSAEVTNFIPVSLNRQIIRSYLGLKILCKRTIHLLFLPLAIRSAETKKSLFVYIFTHLFI